MTLAVVRKHPPAETGLAGRLIAERYRVLEVIGRGGMGVVYSATDDHGGADVVIKFLAPEWTGDPDATARFEREAQRLGTLRHPNIVRMRDYGHDEGRAYLILEFVHGQPLTQRLRSATRLSLPEFVPIAAQILKGVGHAHTRGVVLRDIKASNVMVCDRKGRSDFVVLLDFGLAKRLEGDTPITRGHVMGTAGYIAPETLSGETAGLASDVYALGVLFWTMLVGTPPFDAEDEAAVLYKTVHEPIPDLQETLGPDAKVPSRLAGLIERCLSKSPQDRPKDANAIVEALIDAVPMRLFRLPRLPGVEPIRRGEGNSGMIALTGMNPSGKYSKVLPPSEAPPKNQRRLWFAVGALSFAAGVVAFFPSRSETPAAHASVEPTEVQRAAVSPVRLAGDQAEVLPEGPSVEARAPVVSEEITPGNGGAEKVERLPSHARKRRSPRRAVRAEKPSNPQPAELPEPTATAASVDEAPTKTAAATESSAAEAKPPVLLRKPDEGAPVSVEPGPVEKASSRDGLMRPQDPATRRVPALMRPG